MELIQLNAQLAADMGIPALFSALGLSALGFYAIAATMMVAQPVVRAVRRHAI